MRSATIGGVGWILVACSGAPAPVDADTASTDAGLDAADPAVEACGGARPPLSECARGLFDADCGGTGEPTFACSEGDGTCRWFATGCVAADHHVSACPVGDLCCETTEGGDWPFADGWTGPLPFGHEIALTDIAIAESDVLTASGPFNLAVVIDPTYVAEPPSFGCSGTTPVGTTFPCGDLFSMHAPLRSTETFVLETMPSVFGSTLIVELVPRPDTTPEGRVFVGFHNDASRPPVAACEPDRGRGLAASGTLTITELAPGAHGLLVAVVGDATLRVAF